ncbi:MAG: DNA integrity scanning protein DisA nucleotide-binding domain protein [Deltaproteobacteria bacterium]|nr:DNA integrity scanning protein DisA nucleotide-binding domain protein [Deltaproteobacteria bacterium]
MTKKISSEMNKIMFENALGLMDGTKASAIIVFLDATEDWRFWKESARKKDLVLVTQKPETLLDLKPYRDELKGVVKLPEVKLTRIGQIKLSTIMCITESAIKSCERIVCLTGLPARGVLDTLIAIDLEKETEIFTTRGISKDLLKKVKPEVIETVLNIALELSSEGREGKAVGTTFVIGDHERVEKLSRPLIMNPFKGYPEETRNIMDEAVHETIKEFALLDGAFIIREDGIVMSAGVHLDAALEEEGHKPGLGCRHMAAAGITDVTDAIAITISGSTGIVRIFRKGRTLLEMEKAARPERDFSSKPVE